MARLRYNYAKKQDFGEKVEVWSFSWQQRAKWNSTNREREISVTKTIKPITIFKCKRKKSMKIFCLLLD